MNWTRTRWARFLLPGVIAVGLLAGGSFYLTRGALSSGPAAGQVAGRTESTADGCGTAGAGSCAGSQSAIAIAASPVVVTISPHVAASHAHRAKSSSSASASPSASAPATSPSVQSTQSATGTPAAQPSASASTSAPAVTTKDSAAAGQVLALINQARASAGLPALTITSGLETSSSAHNITMAGGCGLSHQCPGEPALGDRETAAGVHWTAAGENIGEGGPVADTSAAIAQMAVGLTQSMLDEKPPNDGHRQNILSSTFTHIGIAVYRDGSGTVWLTQDFSN
ncbi:CAP domain-containing protein [Trebonia kvetii]|uniref:CAP domain-containing protein n=1 Tax=Trebonia kvetii TaxID=2480626 RepID=A0A6P2C744_9ACTN|nr:CAP domain-containing protein [Trebonia kvetii]TVZ07030.1 CAP domain-containing protein [Trebonia kvetii]